MVGVVGTDAYAARIEQELRQVIRGAGAPCAVVNASGRVVTATESRREPGSMLRIEGLSDALAPLREPDPVGRLGRPARRTDGPRLRRHLARARRGI